MSLGPFSKAQATRSAALSRRGGGLRMAFTSLLFACILTELTFSTQALVSVSNVTAECGEQVAIRCNASTRRDGLSVKHMEWSRNHKPLCQVDGEGKLNHSRNAKSHLRCEYKKGQLSLIFAKVQPEDSGASNRYMCKLRSNWGISHGYSWIELQDCCGVAKGVLSKDGPVCTFSYVHPNGDVLWSHASRSQSEGPVRQNTFKSVEEGGWLTIQSQLEWNSDGPLNCSLMSVDSGRHISCNSSDEVEFLDGYGLRPQGSPRKVWNGAASLVPFRTSLLISIIIVVMQK
ncbi:uncharacterized protein LOC133404139 isoform X1 [Phycodurus eques]|uniref:uncharacterized protein LOC133404139 isoform X1 n=1 Tax=Phycodurus eques TaxID=693459 RepID=UPI002ACEB621|nr:uncharacterized protein LOC133404139 isoform X1 [Phycodurus eques]